MWLYNRRLTFQFATRYVAEHAATLPTDLETYLDRFEIEDAVVDEFIEFLRWPSLREQLEAAQVPLDDETLDGAREDIRMYLQAHIAANIWGLEAGRIALLRHDGQVQQSLGLVPQAADLMELKPQVAAGF